MNGEGKYYHYVEATENSDAKVEWVTVEGAPTATDTTAITDEQAKAIADSKAITIQTTDTNGAAKFIGIKDGTYYLVEAEAPVGYNRYTQFKQVSVNGTNVDNDNHVENLAQPDTNFDSNANARAIVEVENSTGVLLPSTGGIGTTIFYIVGGILIIAGVAYFILRRKTNTD